jgi:hypothetical protein
LFLIIASLSLKDFFRSGYDDALGDEFSDPGQWAERKIALQIVRMAMHELPPPINLGERRPQGSARGKSARSSPEGSERETVQGWKHLHRRS